MSCTGKKECFYKQEEVFLFGKYVRVLAFKENHVKKGVFKCFPVTSLKFLIAN